MGGVEMEDVGYKAQSRGERGMPENSNYEDLVWTRRENQSWLEEVQQRIDSASCGGLERCHPYNEHMKAEALGQSLQH